MLQSEKTNESVIVQQIEEEKEKEEEDTTPPIAESELWPLEKLCEEVVELNGIKELLSAKQQWRSERRRHSVDLLKYVQACLTFKQKEKEIFMHNTQDKRQLKQCLLKYADEPELLVALDSCEDADLGITKS